MKSIIYSTSGIKKSEIELPKLFETKIRLDIVQKIYEAEKFLSIQPNSPDPKAGKKHSASGTISHKRHDWKGHYGHGQSRVPRKTMWRRGTQFFWIGAEISSTRGGRRAHPPKIRNRLRKINKKEFNIGFNSALAATADKKHIISRYDSLSTINFNPPLIIESNLDKFKTKDFENTLKEILGKTISIALKNRKVRAGKGKLRGRKYKSNAGLLIVTGKKEIIKMSKADVIPVNQLSLSNLYPLGRLTLYTEKAINELGVKK